MVTLNWKKQNGAEGREGGGSGGSPPQADSLPVRPARYGNLGDEHRDALLAGERGGGEGGLSPGTLGVLSDGLADQAGYYQLAEFLETYKKLQSRPA